MHDIAGRVCPGCAAALHPIGESVSEMLDWVPASVRLLRIRCPKYACRCCETVVQATAPKRLIACGLPTPAMLAQVLRRPAGCGDFLFFGTVSIPVVCQPARSSSSRS